MADLALTLGASSDSDWLAVTDHGEQLQVPRAAAGELRPVLGQRVVAHLDAAGEIVSISIGGTAVGLPEQD